MAHFGSLSGFIIIYKLVAPHLLSHASEGFFFFLKEMIYLVVVSRLVHQFLSA